MQLKPRKGERQPSAANLEVVDALRRRLDEAERGELVGIVSATIMVDGQVKLCLCGTAADSPAMAAAITARLKARIDLMLLA